VPSLEKMISFIRFAAMLGLRLAARSDWRRCASDCARILCHPYYNNDVFPTEKMDSEKAPAKRAMKFGPPGGIGPRSGAYRQFGQSYLDETEPSAWQTLLWIGQVTNTVD